MFVNDKVSPQCHFDTLQLIRVQDLYHTFYKSADLSLFWITIVPHIKMTEKLAGSIIKV
jgi:hypothetical protein